MELGGIEDGDEDRAGLERDGEDKWCNPFDGSLRPRLLA